MLASRLVAGIAALALMTTACKRAPKGPVGVTWKDGLATFTDAPGESLYLQPPMVGHDNGDVVLRWSGPPPGAKAIFGGKTLEGAALVEARVPLGDALYAVSPAHAFDVTYTHDFDVPITFVVNGHELPTKAPPLTPAHTLRSVFERVKAGKPVHIGASRASGHAVVMFGDPTFRFFGDARTLADVDWVAFETRAAPRASNKSCGGYKAMGKPDSKSLNLVLKRVDFIVDVYDRETAKLVEQRTFEAPDECPSMTSVVKNSAESYPAPTAVDDWLKKRLVSH